MASGDETARKFFISRAGADAAIALLSPAYTNSEYTAAEWQAALLADPFNEKNRLIVLREAECDPRGLPAAMAHWDLVPPQGRPRSRIALTT